MEDLSPRKKQRLITHLRWKENPTRSGRPITLGEAEREFVLDFLESEDISYTLPGRKDQVYISKNEGKSEYKAKHYLLWSLKELTGICNQKESVGSFVMNFGKGIKLTRVEWVKLIGEVA